MTVIPDLERQLVRAAARASAAPARRGRRWRLTVAAALGVASVVVAVAAIDLGGGGDEANAATKVLEQAARNAAGGLAAPLLHPGQAWFTRELDMIASPWEPSVRGQIPPTAVLPSSTAIAQSQSLTEQWTFYDGDGRGHSRQVGRPQFFGSASERRH
ncbi:MAG: hypothetical protein WAL38_21885, partial [Solirubrobacteraceae bacterium]